MAIRAIALEHPHVRIMRGWASGIAPRFEIGRRYIVLFLVAFPHLPPYFPVRLNGSCSRRLQDSRQGSHLGQSDFVLVGCELSLEKLKVVATMIATLFRDNAHDL